MTDINSDVDDSVCRCKFLVPQKNTQRTSFSVKTTDQYKLWELL